MIKYLDIEQVIKINQQLAAKFNSKEKIGVIDRSLLESAVIKPKQSLFGRDLYNTIWDKATILFGALGRSNLFYSGNKCTAFSALIIFLYINDIDFEIDQKDVEDFIDDMIHDKYSFKELSTIIKMFSDTKGKNI